MEEQKLVEILALMLAANPKWRDEVQTNIMLQNSLEELFSDRVFQVLLENGLFPKSMRTNMPHFRATELILAVRETVRQMYEEGAETSLVERQLEDFQLKISDRFGPVSVINVGAELERVLEEATELARVYREDPQFSNRLDNFRLLVLPLCIERGESGRSYQLLVLENIRPPRNAWSKT